MKFTIITVCLNSEKTIEQTIQSVVGQKYHDLEYVVIDGGSHDSTLEIINKYRSEIASVISEHDQGIYDAMNKGIALATGDIIGIINSDDWYEPGTFQYVADFFRETDAEVVYGNLNLISENGEIKVQIPDKLSKICYQMETPHPTVFVRKRLYEKYGGFQLKYEIASDYELMLRFYVHGAKFVYLNRVMANFRLGGISIKKKKKCEKETIMISGNYLPYLSASEKQDYGNLIIYNRRVLYFAEMLDYFPGKLPQILYTKFSIDIAENIVVFGAGRWGIETYDALYNYGIKPLFIVDNNRKKWGMKIGKTEVYSPDLLRYFKGVLLLIVKNSSEEILRQIQTIHNSEICCIVWEMIADNLD